MVNIYKATDIFQDTKYNDLLCGSNGAEAEWSALTMPTKANNQIIIHNPFHSESRQQSNIMHELAHILCSHKTNETNYDFEIPFGLRYFDEQQEEEAKCLGATLQLAKPCLFWAIKKSMSYEAIATYFTASIDMVKYRMNMTGLAKRLR